MNESIVACHGCFGKGYVEVGRNCPKAETCPVCNGHGRIRKMSDPRKLREYSVE